MEKYDFTEEDATELADFLVPILDFVPEKRPSAAQLLLHPWIESGPRLRQPADLSDGGALEKQRKQKDDQQKKEKDEREAMATELGNIAIDGAPKLVKDPPQSNSKPSKAAIASTQQ